MKKGVAYWRKLSSKIDFPGKHGDGTCSIRFPGTQLWFRSGEWTHRRGKELIYLSLIIKQGI